MPQAWIADAPQPPAPTPDAGTGTGTGAEADPNADLDGEGEGRAPGRPPIQVSLEGSGGSRGEASAQAILQWRGEMFALGLGAEGSAGPRVAPRQGLIVQGEIGLPTVALHGELRVRPAAAGASRFGAEVGARVESAAGSLDLSLLGVSAQAVLDPRGGETARGAQAELATLGATIEGEAAVTRAVAVGLRLSAFADRLRWRGRAPQQPWEALGAALQEWPDRWEALASVRGTAGALSIGLGAGAGAPAAAGALAARAGLRVELEAGAATWAASLGGAHQWPADLWLGELTLAASFRFGGR